MKIKINILLAALIVTLGSIAEARINRYRGHITGNEPASGDTYQNQRAQNAAYHIGRAYTHYNAFSAFWRWGRGDQPIRDIRRSRGNR